jgi:hypothetical protein
MKVSGTGYRLEQYDSFVKTLEAADHFMMDFEE